MSRSWRRRRVRPVQQMEAAECGVACLAMVLGYHGYHAPLSEVRAVCGTSRDGNSALDLLTGAKRLGLSGRGLSMSLDALGDLVRPAILHWDMNHFVVFEAQHARGITVVDPTSGRRRVPLEQVDRLFSGVAVELAPGPAFQRRKPTAFSALRYRAALARSKSALVFVLSANLLGQLLALVFPAASQVLIDYVIVPAQSQWLAPVLGAMLLGAIAQVLLTKLQGASQAILQGGLGLELTTELGRRLLNLPLPFLESRSHGDLLERVHLQGELQGLVARAAQAAFDALSILLLGGLMLAYDLRLGALAFGLMVMRVSVIQLLRRASEQRIAAELAARGREQGALVEATSSHEMIKGLALEQRVAQRYSRRVTERCGLGIGVEQLERGLASGLSVLGSVMEAAILWYGGGRVIAGHMTLGVFAGFLAIRAMIEAPFGALVALFSDWVRFRGALERSDDVLSVPAASAGSRVVEQITGKLEARNLGFTYGSGGSWVLRHVNLSIQPGEKVGFVGPSGHGKSTLGKLLAGLLEPTEGEVLLDGSPIGCFDRVSLARHFGVVLQDPLILEGSVAEALRLRVPDASEKSLRDAVESACLREVIEKLPAGYASRLLPLGVNLSGGERQRLGLAQALVGAPQVLLLDEATSALDVETERRVLDNLDGLPSTILSIAHRDSVLSHVSRVFLVFEGSVTERPDTHSASPISGTAVAPTPCVVGWGSA